MITIYIQSICLVKKKRHHCDSDSLTIAIIEFEKKENSKF